jgi:hypothetical protein
LNKLIIQENPLSNERESTASHLFSGHFLEAITMVVPNWLFIRHNLLAQMGIASTEEHRLAHVPAVLAQAMT